MACAAVTSSKLSRYVGHGILYKQVYRGFLSTPYCFNATEQPTKQVSEDGSTKQPNTEHSDDIDYKTLLEEKQKLLEVAQKEASDFKDKYVRSLAENENILRRNQKLLADSKLFAIQGFSKDLLEISDILEKATTSVSQDEMKTNSALSDLYQGLTMTDIELHKVFAKHGLEKVDPVGEKFDPNFHEALFEIPDANKEKGTVAIVQKVGYRLYGRTVRAALVGVVQ